MCIVTQVDVRRPTRGVISVGIIRTAACPVVLMGVGSSLKEGKGKGAWSVYSRR